jgi:hypothetical protein
MAIGYEDWGLSRAFVLGRGTSPHAGRSARLASLLDRGLSDERPPLALAVAKLAVWMLVGITVTSAVAVGVGAVIVRFYAGAFG